MNATDDLPQPNDVPTPQNRTVSLLSQEQVTAIQVNTLLHAVGMLSQIIRAPDSDTIPKNDGGATMAAETTLIKACNRLDCIFDDAKRWTLDSQHELEDHLHMVYDMHIDLMETQKAAVAEIRSPHRAASPKLLKLESGQWAAVLGDPNKPENALIGVGNSPAEAISDFDRVFNGELKNEQNNKMVGSGDSTINDAPGAGGNLSGDCGEAGPDDSGGKV